MNPENLSAIELQEAYLQYGRNFDKFLGISYQEMRVLVKSKGIKNPTEYIRLITLGNNGVLEILYLLAQLGTWEKVAKHFSISESFLRSIFKECKPIGEFDNPYYNEQIFKDEVRRLGSVEFFSRVKGVTPSSVRKWAKQHKIELPALLSYEGVGFENAKGRKAELLFKIIRGNNIIKDMNEAEGSQSSYDFEDKVLGKVDVKSSKRFKYKAKTRKEYPYFFKFSVDNLTCDYVVFVAMDERFKNNIGMIAAPSKSIPLNYKTLTINQYVFQSYTIPGEIHIADEDFIHYREERMKQCTSPERLRR